MVSPFSEKAMHTIGVYCVVGAVLGYIALAKGLQLLFVIALCALFAIALFVQWKRNTHSRMPLRLLTALLFLCWFLLRLTAVYQQPAVTGPIYGRVCEAPDSYGVALDNAMHWDGEQWNSITGKVSLTNYKFEGAYGDWVIAQTELETPDTKRNPGSFDSRMMNLADGVSLAGYAEEITVVHSHGFSLRGAAIDLRSAIETAIDRSMASERAAMLIGILFGDSSHMDFDTLEDFRTSGTAHILAVSGLHVGVLASALLFCLKKLHKRRWGVRLAVILPVLLLFAAMADFSVSVMRAVIMACAAVMIRGRGLGYDLMDGLSIAAVVQCVMNPACVLTIGFWLSYGAVLGIRMVLPRLEQLIRRIPEERKTLRNVCSSAALSFSAQLGILPASVAAFGRLPLLSIVWNVVCVPFTAAVMIFGLVGGVLSAICFPLGGDLLLLAGELCHIMRTVSGIGGSVGISAVTVGGGSVLVFAGFVLLLCGLSIYAYSGKCRIALTGLAAVLAVSGILVSRPPADALRITFLDVGQGDSIVISKGSETIIVDGGNRSAYTDKGKSVLLPYLRYEGIAEVNAILATHNDSDHAGGLLRVVERVPSAAILLASEERTSSVEELTAAAAEYSVPVRLLTRGDQIFLGDAALTVVYENRTGEGNEASAALLLEYNGFRALLMGDCGKKAERALLAADIGDVHLLKVAHHGSNSSTSAEFLSAIAPEYAVISVAERNAYGLPGAALLERLENSGAKLLTTAQSGAITFTITEDQVFVDTMLK